MLNAEAFVTIDDCDDGFSEHYPNNFFDTSKALLFLSEHLEKARAILMAT